jgi:uroporphyrin-III C-methyltransferase
MHENTVYLTGFGPGDPELMTLKAHHTLEKADIIFYDDLIDKTILINYKAEKKYVGKRRGKHSKSQEEINHMLFEAACNPKNKVIVRLKGGDPLIFGRVGEELDYLIQKGVKVELIPGISAGNAAAARLKIPLTQRYISSSVSYCSGHIEERIFIPQTDTIIFYMCAKNALCIFKKLIQYGYPDNTPVALLTDISNSKETVKISTLLDELDKKESYPSPLIIIVGDVVKKAANYA